MSLLWFRRSRREEAKQEPQPAPEAPPRQARVALHIRGLLFLNLKPGDGPEAIELAPPLGQREFVVTALQTLVPGIHFDAHGRGEVAGQDYRVSIDIGEGTPVHTAVAAADGDTGIELLRTVMQSQGWRAYAPKSGVFIDSDALDLFALPDERR